ncbi:MAG: type II toxin-antitoxin system mRNA interferase toxin, RelE/StbE family [Spirochaetes bacterium]|nr:MAG: type II toxin-antitoxin system mRNA interferase toxin, RelE/StbE family [Spirochaetota bacterium]
MWEIYEHHRLLKILPKLPENILKRYEKWKDIARVSGPQGLRVIKGFNDEALHGNWENYRSSRLSKKYRIIYQIEAQEILIYVVNLTAHDYRRK